MDLHPDSALIDQLGTTTEVAGLMRVRPQAVSQWRRDGIPRARRQTLELLRPDIFGVDDAQRTGPPGGLTEADLDAHIAAKAVPQAEAVGGR